VMKICDVVIYLQFARDGGDFQMRKKLSVSSTAFGRENQFVIVVAERFERRPIKSTVSAFVKIFSMTNSSSEGTQSSVIQVNCNCN